MDPGTWFPLDFSIFDILPLGFALTALIVMLRPRIRDSKEWRATVTPLASIIGSGFLIVAPLLATAVGSTAVAAISSIILLSLWAGSAIRYNIEHDGDDLVSSSISGASRLESLADSALAVAFVISISFYLRLMAAFVLDGADWHSEMRADILSIVIVLSIGLYGWRNGLLGLERLEEYSVTVKLSIIGALLLWLFGHDWVRGYDLSGLRADEQSLFEQLRLLGGMLLIVQGFETSRYLGSEYGRDLRARSMLRAQILAGLIYIVFVAFSLPLMSNLPDEKISETAIIDISAMVTPMLPPLLVIAAIMSQFSAAVADTIGAGGVIEQESGSRISARASYLVITFASCALLLLTNIFELVSFASRAFAFYYFLQSLLATRFAWAFEEGKKRMTSVASFALLSMIMLFIVIFGKAVEG